MAFLRGSSIYCITKSEISPSERLAFSSICISTATISSFGAIVQIVNWYKKLQLSESRRIISPSPSVLFSLALADLFTCVGAIAMSILFLNFNPAQKTNNGQHRPAHHNYIYIGMPVESFTMFSYIASYMWTLFYAFDVCLRVHDLQLCHKIYHVLSWPSAAWLVACVQFAIYESDSKNCSPPGSLALLHYLVCYVPLFVVMVCLPIIYWKAYRKVSQNITHTGYFTDAERRVQKSVRKKFCYIIVVFMFCWLPNFIDGFHDIKEYIVKPHHNFYRSHDHPFVWFIEGSVNPLQGFLNCLVYGQHGQFVSCFGHIRSHFQTTYVLNDDGQEERSKTWTVNSLSGTVKIPVTESSPLLAESRRSTPVLSTPISDSPSKREPFHAKLLGEFSHLTK